MTPALTDKVLLPSSSANEPAAASLDVSSYASALGQIARNIDELYLLVGVQGDIRYLNRAAEAIFSTPFDDTHLTGQNICTLLPGVELDRLEAGSLTDAVIVGGDVVSLSVLSVSRLPNGSYQLLLSKPSALRWERDAALRQRELLQLIHTSVMDALVLVGLDGQVELVNPAASEYLCLSGDRNHQQQPLESLLKYADTASAGNLRLLIDNCGREGVTLRPQELLLVNRQGHRPQRLSLQLSPVRNARNQVDGVLLVFRPEILLPIGHDAHNLPASHDGLTLLLNRQSFEGEINSALAAVNDKGGSYGLLLIDIYQFKLINDACGSQGGDELLKQVARLFQSLLRSQDILARMGSDEFGLLLKNCTLAGSQRVADLLLRAIQNFRFVWESREIKVSICVGAITIDASSESTGQILANANAACCLAREEGRNKIHFYNHDMLAQEHRSQIGWVVRLHEAMAENRLKLYRQAVLPLQEEEIIPHYEVLVRLIDEDGAIVGPGDFIPAAERYGMMDDVDRWVVSAVIECLVRRQQEGLQPQSYAVNLSGVTVGDASFVDFVLEKFSENSFDTSLLHFELTETAAVKNLDRAIHFINVMKERGCKFYLDDFGSGLSSFGYLKELPVDFLKIDGSFVASMLDNPSNYAMVSTFNHLAHVMKLKTVAEFVEDNRLRNQLQAMGIDYGQGYGLARPEPMSDDQP